MASAPIAMSPRQILTGSLPEMEQEFQERARSEPDNADVQFVWGMLAYRRGRSAAAVDSISRAILLDPGNADFHHGLGIVQSALGRLDEAVVSSHKALRLRPEFDEALVHLASVLTAQGQLDKAAEILQAARQRRPNNAAVAAALAQIQARRGQLDTAVAVYLHALQLRPDDPDLHNELGIVYARQDRFEAAAIAYRAALQRRPDHADAHNNLGNTLRHLGRLDEAIACYNEALRLRPDYPEGYNNLGIAWRHKGAFDEAIACYRKALDLRPTYIDAHNNLGLALAARGRLEAAVISFEHATRLRPNDVESLCRLADGLADMNRLDEAVARYREALAHRPQEPRLHKNLGIALARQEKYDEAVACYREALRLRPDYPEAYNDLGIAYSRQHRHAEAIASYQEALRHRPRYPEVLNNLGNALRLSGEFAASIAYYRQALELRPNYADAYNNQGIALAELGRFEEAATSYTRCLQLRPDHVDAHLNRALTWLRKGDFRRGWAEYEWRWKKRGAQRAMVQPLWNGTDPAGLRILLTTEQGLGDTIQFIRYAAELKRRGAETILECPEPLVKLMAYCPGVDRVVPRGQPLPEHDVYCPLLTLPGLTDTLDPERFPREVPYFQTDSALVDRWRRELEASPGFRVGINWQGNPGYGGDRHRSIPLAQFEPLARVPGVRLISLQKNHGLEQLEALGDRFSVLDLGRRLDTESGPFLDTAAVLTSLDLFITCDTSVGHLAASLGVPTWLALSAAPDWRWLLGREDSPWYPTVRLFRQADYMVWPPVFERMAEALAALVPASRRTRPILAAVAPGDLIDRITILRIKSERLTDPEKLRHVHTELAELEAARDRAIPPCPELARLTAEVRTVNEVIWQVEDEIRRCEAAGDFGPRFIELARSVYQTNDQRAAWKRRINMLLGSTIVEEKSHASPPLPVSAPEA